MFIFSTLTENENKLVCWEANNMRMKNKNILLFSLYHLSTPSQSLILCKIAKMNHFMSFSTLTY